MAVTLVGVISDTHGLLRPEALRALRGVSLVIVAGDVGKPEVLVGLAELAPVYAVRGNVDRGGWAKKLPSTRVVEVAGKKLYVLHALADLAVDPVREGYAAVISGHSHQPKREVTGGVLYLNPGSAGPRRFKLPVALALLRVGTRTLDAKLITLI